MQQQIKTDLSSFQNRPISMAKLLEFYNRAPPLLLVKFTIHDNKLYYEKKYDDGPINDRRDAFVAAFSRLCKRFRMPNTTFLLSLGDGLEEEETVPIFVMSKKRDLHSGILIPDFESLKKNYQVLEKKDITQMETSWEGKKPQLVWRGSTAQWNYWPPHGKPIPFLSRVELCALSSRHPEVIDAKFTSFPGSEHLPYFTQYQGSRISFEDQLQYKYHIHVDGNASAYSCSGWKLFTNSLLFKPDSEYIQWYSNALEPYVHYVPVKRDLGDLMEKIRWAIANDDQSKIIAANCRQFAKNNITKTEDMLYIYQAIKMYSELNFTE